MKSKLKPELALQSGLEQSVTENCQGESKIDLDSKSVQEMGVRKALTTS
jgi:hypothetical protein